VLGDLLSISLCLDHVVVSLSVQMNKKNHVSTDFTFFDCNQHKSYVPLVYTFLYLHVVSRVQVCDVCMFICTGVPSAPAADSHARGVCSNTGVRVTASHVAATFSSLELALVHLSYLDHDLVDTYVYMLHYQSAVLFLLVVNLVSCDRCQVSVTTLAPPTVHALTLAR
jgi:hypothetical protein